MSAPPPRRALRVHIDELRLEGFREGDRYRIAHAMQRELARLLAARAAGGDFEAPRAAARVDGGSFSFAADEPADRIGAAIARATFGGLTGPARGGPGRDGE